MREQEIDLAFNDLMAAIGNLDSLIAREPRLEPFVGNLHVPTILFSYYPMLQEIRGYLSQLVYLLGGAELQSTEYVVDDKKIQKLLDMLKKEPPRNI